MGWRVVLAMAGLGCGLISACGDDVTASPDTGTAPDAATTIEVTAPEPPVLTPCPAGWIEEVVEGVTVCEPWPAGAADECGAVEYHLPGRNGCEPVGTTCPAGDFADDLPDDGSVVFVRPGAMGGDGSRGSPLGTIVAALGAVPVGGTVALSKGRFDESVSIERGVTLRGACVAETELVFTPTVSASGVVVSRGDGVVIRDLAVGRSPHIGIAVRSGSVTIRSVSVDGALEVGVLVVGASANADGLRVVGTRPSARGFGRGLDIESEGSFEGTRVSLRDNAEYSAFVGEPGSRLALDDFAIGETFADAAGGQGWGAQATAGGSLELTRGVIEGSRQGAIAVFSGGSLVGRDLVVRDTSGRESDLSFGCGVALEESGNATLERVRVEDVYDVAIIASSTSSLTLTDALLRDISAQQSDGLLGRGISVQGNSNADVSRTAIVRARNIALFAVEASDVTATDISLRDTQPGQGDNTGWGVFARDAAAVTMERAEVVRSRDLGVHISGADTTFAARDLVVREVASRGADGEYGRGIDVELGATAMIERAMVVDTRNTGVFVGAMGTSATLRDLVVDGVTRAPCAPESCGEVASGLAVISGATVTVESFAIANADICGVLVAGLGELDLSNGEVSSSAIGACVPIPGYVLDRLTADVRYRDNGTNLDTDDALPLPKAAPPIEN